MIETIILEQPSARTRFLTAPCLEEREQYLFHLMRLGYGHHYLRSISGLMLRVIRFLGLTRLRAVGLDEIEKAGQAWAVYRGPDRRGKPGNSPGWLPIVAKNWLRFHGQLAIPPTPLHPYDKELTDFSEFLRSTNGLSPATVDGYSSRASAFLTWMAGRGRALCDVSLTDADEFFVDGRERGWCIWTISNHTQALRRFFFYAGERGWCRPVWHGE